MRMHRVLPHEFLATIAPDDRRCVVPFRSGQMPLKALFVSKSYGLAL